MTWEPMSISAHSAGMCTAQVGPPEVFHQRWTPLHAAVPLGKQCGLQRWEYSGAGVSLHEEARHFKEWCLGTGVPRKTCSVSLLSASAQSSETPTWPSGSKAGPRVQGPGTWFREWPLSERWPGFQGTALLLCIQIRMLVFRRKSEICRTKWSAYAVLWGINCLLQGNHFIFL